ncbi:hypothetical protein NNO_1663 [Hydrogenimonas sp.]|nr:hypothetical protein NNO_1663 [Hydrogenimonas sp.]
MVRQALTLTLLLAAYAAAEEYYISYSLTSRNLLAVGESLKISRAMTPLHGGTVPLCSFETEEKSFLSWARKNRAALTECLLSHAASIRSYNSYVSLTAKRNLDILTTPVIPVQVDFNDGLVTIKKIQ